VSQILTLTGIYPGFEKPISLSRTLRASRLRMRDGVTLGDEKTDDPD
jgi:hypothetical protein